jgi:phosphatidylglycerol---prolipoprotein diacylglyceryl transferase
VRPTLITVAGRSIPAFQTMQYVGVLAGLTLGAEVARRLGEDPDRFLIAGFALFLPAVIGAHLGPALIRGSIRRRSWILPEEGSAIFFALPGLILTAPFVVWVAGLSAGAFLDGAAVAVVTGTIFGRIGCLFQGCCAGRPTSARLGIQLTDVHAVHTRRLPTQLLDVCWATLLLGALLFAVDQLPAGICFFFASLIYGAGRFLTDFTRQHRPPAGGLSQAQLASLGLIAGGSCALLLTLLFPLT